MGELVIVDEQQISRSQWEIVAEGWIVQRGIEDVKGLQVRAGERLAETFVAFLDPVAHVAQTRAIAILTEDREVVGRDQGRIGLAAGRDDVAVEVLVEALQLVRVMDRQVVVDRDGGAQPRSRLPPGPGARRRAPPSGDGSRAGSCRCGWWWRPWSGKPGWPARGRSLPSR